MDVSSTLCTYDLRKGDLFVLIRQGCDECSITFSISSSTYR